MPRGDHEVFELGDPVLQRGATLRGARLAHTTYGTLAADRRNAVVYPTWYSGRHWENEWLIGPGMALDPSRWFIIVPNMLGHELSSSPSNTPPPYDRARFPEVTVHDNVEAQHRLVTEQFGIEHLACVTGWSIGAGQTFQWAVSHPEMVSKILPFCGSARTSEHNRELGPNSLEDFLVGFWEGFFLDDRDADNLLTMLWTWQHGDVGATPGFDGDLDRALASITARAIVMPAEKDLHFPPEDEEYEVSRMPDAELRVIPGVRGHSAGGRANPQDTAFIDRALAELLAE